MVKNSISHTRCRRGEWTRIEGDRLWLGAILWLEPKEAELSLRRTCPTATLLPRCSELLPRCHYTTGRTSESFGNAE